MQTDIFLVRHGQSRSNVEGYFLASAVLALAARQVQQDWLTRYQSAAYCTPC